MIVFPYTIDSDYKDTSEEDVTEMNSGRACYKMDLR